MMKKVLVALDGGTLGRELARFAFRYAKKEKMRHIDFVHVYEEHPLTAFPGMPVPVDFNDSFRSNVKAEFEQMLKETAAESGCSDLNYGFSMPIGSPYNEVVKIAEQDEDYQLIIVGHRSVEGLDRFLIGSVAAKVVSHAPCNVLVFRPRNGPVKL